jgi:hypothetical protein
MDKPPTRLGDVIERVVSAYGLGDNYRGWKIVALWPEIVGKQIARRSRAVRFSDGAVVVIVESDAWRQELEMQREQILRKIRALPGGSVVNKIILKAGPLGEFDNGQDCG